ncbi:unnamed protein product [Cylindrotheca closterium]|uniref:DIX domain-containing protein n=1 Tax=Cylindrotheca closterium TaxID=2856 RepID=A0AAD2CLU8_9STRA|nr:unnamed protein product [Cylindrotheca closterium]
MTTIRYFIPEDGDEETHPNVFLAPKPRHPGTPPTLGQIKDAFPLPGTYHFRFKSPLYPGGDRDKGAMSVWMDLVNDADPIPTWKNGIVAKITRISMEDDDDDDDDFPIPTPAATPAANPRAPPSHQSSMASQGSSDHLDIFDGPSPGVTATPASNAAPNLFDTPAAAPASGGSLLDMNENYASTQAKSSAHADFLGMTAPTAQPGYPAAGNPNMYPAQQQQRPPQQQQQNTFNSYAAQQGPFGGLGTPWKP